MHWFQTLPNTFTCMVSLELSLRVHYYSLSCLQLFHIIFDFNENIILLLLSSIFFLLLKDTCFADDGLLCHAITDIKAALFSCLLQYIFMFRPGTRAALQGWDSGTVYVMLIACNHYSFLGNAL